VEEVEEEELEVEKVEEEEQLVEVREKGDRKCEWSWRGMEGMSRRGRGVGWARRGVVGW